MVVAEVVAEVVAKVVAEVVEEVVADVSRKDAGFWEGKSMGDG